MTNRLQQNYPQFFELNGTALNDGYVYIGIDGLNPETNPISVFLDATLSTPISQPLRTTGGYIYYNGSPVSIYFGSSNYSITVKNSLNTLVYTNLSTYTMPFAMVVENIEELKTFNIQQSNQIETLGYYEKGDGGGGTFYWDSTSTEADNGGTIIQATGITTGRWKRVFSGAVNVKWFGAKGDGITDDTASIQNAFDSNYSVILIPEGNYKIDCTTVGLTLPNNKTIIGSGSLLGYRLSGSTIAVLNLGGNCIVIDIKVSASNTTTTYIDNTSLTTKDSDTNATFNYNEFLMGISMNNNTKLDNVHVSKLWRGITSSGVDTIKVINSTTYQCGAWHTGFYNCTNVIFQNNKSLYGGSAGGVAFPSSKKLTISDNYLKLVGTGINTGGSAAVGFNVEDVNISNNYIIARDCINLENGAINYTITGNTCEVLTDYNLAGTNGVGIANTSDSSGSFQGDCNNGVITGNFIKSYGGNAYSFGIKLGSNVSSGANNMSHFLINSNHIQDCAVGVYAVLTDKSKQIKHLSIVGNNIKAAGYRGISLNNVKDVIINDNDIYSLSSAILSTYYGISLDEHENVNIDNNKMGGWQYLFYLVSTSKTTDVRIYRTTKYVHPITSVVSLNILTDGDVSGTRYFIDEVDTNTDTTNRMTLRANYQGYSPATPITFNGLSGYGCFSVGQVITVLFNGNVTLVHNPPYNILKNGISVTPPNGKHITFISGATGRLTEISRDF